MFKWINVTLYPVNGYQISNLMHATGIKKVGMGATKG